MSAPSALLVILLQGLLWYALLHSSARQIQRSSTFAAVLAYPLLWAATDTLMATFLPDGNWGSLAYTQADFLPFFQAASLAGTPGLLFLLSLPVSALAVAISHPAHRRPLLCLSLLPPLLAIAWGYTRLTPPPANTPTLAVGLASVDDAIGLEARPAYIARIRQSYAALVEQLAQAGARVILLPEKIAVTLPPAAQDWQHFFSSLASRHQVSLIAGLAIQHPSGLSNEAWTFLPTGERQDLYRKRKLAPPERGTYQAGQQTSVFPLAQHTSGIAICKDMHFARLGLDYAQRDTSLVYVPAWEFGLDAWLEARTTATRGVEGGYTIVRNAREGLLSISDAYGRFLAESPSRPLPGTTLLLAQLPVSPRRPTLYSRLGDLFGWACVLAAALAVFRTRRAPLP